MKVKEDFINKSPRLYYKASFLGNPIGAVIIVHGAGEHIGRYEYVQRKLYENGFSSLGFDLRGHGKSEGVISHIERFGDYLEDVYDAYKTLKEMSPNTPIFLIGHSMGGLISLAFCERYHDLFNAVFISSPLLGFNIPVPKFKSTMAKILSSVCPRLHFKNNISPSMVSRSQEIVTSYASDPLVRDLITARWFAEISKGIDNTLKNASNFTYPLLMLQAEIDMLVDPLKSKLFYDQCSSKNKHFNIVKGCYHELMNEPERDEIISRVIEFFKNNI